MKIKKIIFLSSVPFIHNDELKYGFNYYNKSNYSVEIWYLNNVFIRNFKSNNRKLNFKNVTIFNIKDEVQFKELLKKNIKNSIFFLRYTYNYSNKKLFQILTTSKAKYIYSLGILPQDGFNYISKDKKYFFIKLKQIFSKKIGYLKSIILNKIYLKLNRNFFNIKEADFFYVKSKQENKIKNHKLFGKNTKIIFGHHRDYDKYLDFLKIKKRIKKKKTALFIDQGVPYHPDNLEIGLLDLKEQNYYKSINNFLINLMQKYGYLIEISAHPKVSLNRTKNNFKRFKVKQHETISQIYNSDLVITHASTASNFAILFKKKLLFISNNLLNSQSYPFKATFEFFASRLKKKVINIDQFDIKKLNSEIKIIKKNYKNYERKFIKFKGQNIHHASIIINYIKKYYAN